MINAQKSCFYTLLIALELCLLLPQRSDALKVAKQSKQTKFQIKFSFECWGDVLPRGWPFLAETRHFLANRKKCSLCRKWEKICRVQNWTVQHGRWSTINNQVKKARREAGKTTKQADIHGGDLGESGSKIKTVWSSTRQNVQIIAKEYLTRGMQWRSWRWWKWSGKLRNSCAEIAVFYKPSKWTLGRSQRKCMWPLCILRNRCPRQNRQIKS